MKIKLVVVVAVLGFSACGGGNGGGTGGGSGGGTGTTYPEQVKLQGTIEYTTKSQSSSGTVVYSASSKGTFSTTSTWSQLGARLEYDFDGPFTVTGTQAATDVTLNPDDCSKTISGSPGGSLGLVVGAAGNGYVAQLFGNIQTTESGTCANGGNVPSGFRLDVPNDTCPDPAIRVLSNARWLTIGGDPAVGYDFSQDITCDAATIKITISVEGL